MVEKAAGSKEVQQPGDAARGDGAPSLWLAALHDLRQPLQGAQFLVEISLKSDSPEQRRQAALLLEDCLRNLELMLGELARLEKLERGDERPTVTEVDFGLLAGAVCEEVAGLLPGQQVAIADSLGAARTAPADAAVAAMIMRGMLLTAALRLQAGSLSLRLVREAKDAIVEVVLPGMGAVPPDPNVMFAEVKVGNSKLPRVTYMAGLGFITRLARATGGELEMREDRLRYHPVVASAALGP